MDPGKVRKGTDAMSEEAKEVDCGSGRGRAHRETEKLLESVRSRDRDVGIEGPPIKLQECAADKATRVEGGPIGEGGNVAVKLGRKRTTEGDVGTERNGPQRY